MSTEERVLRENRRKNLVDLLRERSADYVAKLIDSNASYISQLKNGFRPVTFETARAIETAMRAPRLSLDSPPGSVASVSSITDKELSGMIASLLNEICKLHNRAARGDTYEAMLRLCVVDARARGYNEGRVRYLAKEFLQ